MGEAKPLHKGEDVTWSWGKGTGEGTVKAVHTKDVTKTIKGKTITRKASAKKPAAEIETDAGATVLKSSTEIKKA